MTPRIKTAISIGAFGVVALVVNTVPGFARADISNVNATVELRDNPDVGHKEAWVVIDYDIANVPSAGSIIDMKVHLTDRNDGHTLTIDPDATDLSGDVGDIAGSGSKEIEWYAEKDLMTRNRQGKYTAQVTLTVRGTGDPTDATLSIASYVDGGWQYFDPGVVQMSNIQPTDGFVPRCSPVQGNDYQDSVSGDVQWYTGQVTSFPGYRGRHDNDVISGAPSPNTGCAAFLAAQDLGTPNQKVWVNFAKPFNMTLGSSGFVWEFQARYFESGAGKNKYMKIGNAGKPGDQQFEILEYGGEFELTLTIANDDEEKSNEFDLDVVRREYKLSFLGVHTMTFKALGDGYFDGDGPNKIRLKDGDATVNGWLHFAGTDFVLDTTTNLATLTSLGTWMDPDGQQLWTGPFNASLALVMASTGDVDPIQMFERWFIAGYSVGVRSIAFQGDPDNASGVKMDVRVFVPQFTAGCSNDGSVSGGTDADHVGGIDLTGLQLGSDGFQVDRVSVTDVGLKHIPVFCLREATYSYDGSKKQLDGDLRIDFKPLFENAGGSISLLDGNIDALHLTLQNGQPMPVNIPNSSTWIGEWKALNLSMSNLQGEIATLSGDATLAGRDDWKTLGGYADLTPYLGGVSLFTLSGSFFKQMDGTNTSLGGALTMFGYSSHLLTNDQQIWLVKGTANMNFLNVTGILALGGDLEVGLVNIPGSPPLFHGTGRSTFTLAPRPRYVMALTGNTTIPKLFAALPYGDYLDKLFHLPLEIVGAGIRMDNLTFSAAAQLPDNTPICITLDLTKDPLLHPMQYLHGCNAIAVLAGRAEHKAQRTLGVPDTTWFDFEATPELTMGVVHVYGDPLPVSVLQDPTGAIRTTDQTGPGVSYYPPQDAGASGMWTIDTPITGTWHVGLVDMQPGDSIFTWGTYAARPRFAFTSREEGRTAIASWTSTDAPSGSHVDFFLDTDTTGEDGVYVGSADETTGEFRYTMTDSLGACGYYLYGVRDDGMDIQSVYASTFLSNPKSWLQPPTNIHAVGMQTTDHVTISWDHSPDTTRTAYLIRVTDASGSDSIYASTRFNYSMTTLDIPDWEHSKLSIQTVGENGATGCWSDPVTFDVADVEAPTTGRTGASELQLQVVPNPASATATLYVNLDRTDLLDIELFDVSGRHVRTLFVGAHPRGTARSEFDVSSLPSGTYVLRVRTSHGTSSRTFVVQH